MWEYVKYLCFAERCKSFEMQQITFEDPMQNAIKYGKKVFTLSRLWNRITKIAEMVFCYENCSSADREKLLKF